MLPMPQMIDVRTDANGVPILLNEKAVHDLLRPGEYMLSRHLRRDLTLDEDRLLWDNVWQAYLVKNDFDAAKRQWSRNVDKIKSNAAIIAAC